MAESHPPVIPLNPPQSGFYSKMVDLGGVPIRTSEAVVDEALFEAYRRLGRLLEHMPDVHHNLVQVGAADHIIGRDQEASDLPELRHMKGVVVDKNRGTTFDQRVRGVGGLAASCGEENLLKLDSDRYRDHRDICSHEFAHTIFIYAFTDEVRDIVKTQWRKSTEAGLWTSYAGSNEHEYFSELTMWFFDSRGDYGSINPPPEPGPDWLKKYDPEGYALLSRIYGGEVRVARKDYQPVRGLNPAEEKNLKRPDSGAHTEFLIDNRANNEDLLVYELGDDGERRDGGTVFACRTRYERCRAGQPFVVARENGEVLGLCMAPETRGRFVVEL